MGAALGHCAGEAPPGGAEFRPPGAGHKFLDISFPPSASSVGTAKAGRAFISEDEKAALRWMRLSELAPVLPQVAWSSVQATDVEQGILGNCWLVSVISALGEYPQVVQDLFLEAVPARGRYVLRLYDMASAAWNAVEVDDFVPCTYEEDWSGIPHQLNEEGQPYFLWDDVHDAQGLKKVPKRWAPVFARPTGVNLWAPILEKALAKFVGSYAGLSGGSEPYAFMACTGFPQVYCFMRPTLRAGPSEAESRDIMDDLMGFMNPWRNTSGNQTSAHGEKMPPLMGDMIGFMNPFVKLRAGQSGGEQEPQRPAIMSDFIGFMNPLTRHSPASGQADAEAGANDEEPEEEAELGRWLWQGAEFIGRSFTGPGSKPVPGSHEDLGNEQLWQKLCKYRERDCLMTASITRYKQPETTLGFFRPDGLVLGHAYSCLGLLEGIAHDGTAVRLVKLRNPHGSAASRRLGTLREEATATSGDGPRVFIPGTWNGDWSETSAHWKQYPEIKSQAGSALYTGSGMFWMCFQDFCASFDKVCVLPKSMRRASTSLPERQIDFATSSQLCISLSKMADNHTLQALREMSLTFDPYLNLPEWLDDGKLETRLSWEATKPGRLQLLLDANRKTPAAYDMLLGKVQELRLEPALGPDGFCIQRPTAE